MRNALSAALEFVKESLDFTDWSRLFQTEILVTNGEIVGHSVLSLGITSEFWAWLVL